MECTVCYCEEGPHSRPGRQGLILSWMHSQHRRMSKSGILYITRTHQTMSAQHLHRSVELAQTSLDAGEFPAGAVLVTKSGKVYESKPSLPHYHGEMMVIDMAIEAEGAPLEGATMYASMQPCLMCSAKMYWSGIRIAHYVIPKSAVKAEYAYENALDTVGVSANFFAPITMTHEASFQEAAMRAYNLWVKRIEQ